MAKVLVVDDEADILEVVEIMLLRHGFIVKKLLEGEQTLQEVKSFKPHVILLDISLRGCDGRDICKKLKAVDSPFKHIPVILFSAMHDLRFNYPECEATDFIPKPFDTAELIEKIKKHAIKTW